MVYGLGETTEHIPYMNFGPPVLFGRIGKPTEWIVLENVSNPRNNNRQFQIAIVFLSRWFANKGKYRILPDELSFYGNAGNMIDLLRTMSFRHSEKWSRNSRETDHLKGHNFA
jgi:hypothetical protein